MAQHQDYQDILAGNQTAIDWLGTVAQNNQITANNYKNHLRKFGWFAKEQYGKTLDELVKMIQANQQKGIQAEMSLLPHNVLSKYLSWINTTMKIVANHKRMLIVTAKQYLVWNDVDISETKIKAKVKLPKLVRKKKAPLSPDVIREILLNADDLRLKTYLHFLAATGCRAVEGLSVRLCDLELEANPPRANFRGEFTKTKQDRHVYLTNEVVHALKRWIDYKYRERRTIIKRGGKMISDFATPEKDKHDLIFAHAHFKDIEVNPHTLYSQFSRKYAQLLDRIELGELEDTNSRRKLTLHSYRRFVKTTIANLGHADYSEWFIGHQGSAYWTASEDKKAELFAKIEQYLMFLDMTALEAEGADQQTRINQLEARLQKERIERERLYELLYKQGIIKKDG